jgi:hypothetical protein
MRRRDLLAGSIVVLSASWAAAQQPAPAHARIGWLAHGDTMPRHFFDEAMATLGWVEGKNLTIKRRFGGSAGERMAEAAAELDHPGSATRSGWREYRGSAAPAAAPD